MNQEQSRRHHFPFQKNKTETKEISLPVVMETEGELDMERDMGRGTERGMDKGMGKDMELDMEPDMVLVRQVSATARAGTDRGVRL